MILLLLAASSFLNIFLLWFLYRLIERQAEISVIFQDVRYKMGFFKKHLNNIYELPMFYGEPTLENLITHSKELLETFDIFEKDILILSGEDEEEYDIQKKI